MQRSKLPLNKKVQKTRAFHTNSCGQKNHGLALTGMKSSFHRHLKWSSKVAKHEAKPEQKHAIFQNRCCFTNCRTSANISTLAHWRSRCNLAGCSLPVGSLWSLNTPCGRRKLFPFAIFQKNWPPLLWDTWMHHAAVLISRDLRR